jgi:predicted ATP-grasp superfamily ATP-dependent carboligase
MICRGNGRGDCRNDADGNWGNYTITKIMRYYPIKGGSSSFCVTIENEKLLNICKEILDKLGWIGFADFDVLEKGDGDYRVIEINPRIPASVKAAAISGVNFGEMIVKDILGEGLPKYTYTPGMQLRCLGLDIAWFLSSPNRWKCKPSWFKFFGKNLAYQEGGSKDFMAMCTSIWMGIKKQLDPSFRKQKSGMN